MQLDCLFKIVYLNWRMLFALLVNLRRYSIYQEAIDGFFCLDVR